jgi:hypothetical protein
MFQIKKKQKIKFCYIYNKTYIIKSDLKPTKMKIAKH